MDNDKLQIGIIDAAQNSKTFTVGYANPSATDALLKQFADKIMELSKDTYTYVRRVKTIDITNAE